MADDFDLVPRWSKYIPQGKHPHPPQQLFLLLDDKREILYGGAAGGGKSEALLMAALQFVDVPGYAGVIFRLTYQDLSKPGALIPRSHEWLKNTDAVWNGTDKQWKFPSGAVLSFGHLEHETDVYSHQSAEYQFIGFDELTQFSESKYKYMLSRLRRKAEIPVPLRARAASNPGNIGHNWVKRRFIDSRHPNRMFIPALLEDNPSLNAHEYMENLRELDPVLRRQLQHGDWDVRPEGGVFSKAWFDNRVALFPPIVALRVRSWDLAGTEGGGDWTVGVRWSLSSDFQRTYIEHVVRKQLSPARRMRLQKAVAHLDASVPGTPTIQLFEQQPGAAGITERDYIIGQLLGFPVEFVRPTGPKEARYIPYRSALQNNRVTLVEGSWVDDFVDEHIALQMGQKNQTDDQIDAASQGFARLFPEGFMPSAGSGSHPLFHTPRRPHRLGLGRVIT